MRYISGIADKTARAGKPVEPLLPKDRKMAKTAEKTADFVENFPSFDATKATDQLRAFAEKSVEQSKEAYAKLKTGAEEAQKALETTFETARTVSGDLSLKTISAFRANAEAGFAHLEALVAAKSLSEVVELQTAYLRKRVETSVDQAKDFQAAASKAAEKVSAPLKTVFEKAVKELKVA
jgi:phasin